MPDGLYAGIFDDLIRTCVNGKRDHAVEQAVYISAADQWYVDRKKRAYGLCISEFYFDVPASRPSLECHDERYDEEEGEWFKSLDLDFKDSSIRCCHIWNLCFCKKADRRISVSAHSFSFP